MELGIRNRIVLRIAELTPMTSTKRLSSDVRSADVSCSDNSYRRKYVAIE